MFKIHKRFLLITALLCNTALAEKTILAPESTVKVEAKLAYPIVLTSEKNSNYLKVSLAGLDNHKAVVRNPINVSLVIDRSGSMSGEKIQQAREAALLVVDILGEKDILSIIGYDTEAEIIVPATKLSDKDDVKAKIKRSIVPNGNTALFAGVSKGIKETQKFFDKNNVNRVILLSDGQANVGPSSTSELGELGRSASKKGITVSTIGLGLGYNEDLMASLASYSDGNHVFVESASTLQSVFKREFDDVMNVIAQDISVEIDIKHGKPLRLLGREGEIRGNHVSVKLNQIYANQEKYVLLEIAPSNKNRQGEQRIADVNISYLSNAKVTKSKHPLKVLYSGDKALVNKAINEDVLAEFYVQNSNLANYQAIKALDQGDAEQANFILQEASEEIRSKIGGFSSSSAQLIINKQSADLEMSAEKAISKSAPAARKSMKAKSYQISNQQK